MKDMDSSTRLQAVRRVRRLAFQYGLVIFTALALNFVLPRLAPGEPIDYLMPPDSSPLVTPEQREALLASYDLDGSNTDQFVTYVKNLTQGDLGVSIRTGQPVREIVAGRLAWSVLLVGVAVAVSTVLGVFLGFAAGWRRGTKRDIGFLAAVLAVDALPAFFVGLMLLLIFSATLDWFPVYGAVEAADISGWALIADVARRLVLPASTLVLAGIGSIFVVSRSALVSELAEDYVFMARAKGLNDSAVRRHAQRNALLPVSTAVLLGFSTLVGAATIVETIFSYPGLGSLAFDSVLARDYPVLQGVFLLLALIGIGANFLSDLLYPLLDPRVKTIG